MRELYFAYGSNMHNASMAERCPKAENLGPAILKDWGLRARHCADIEPAPGEEVHGVVWSVTRECIKNLDWYESVPVFYIKKWVDVTMEGCVAPVKALVYVMIPEVVAEGDEPFAPGYAHLCADGAKENGVDVDPLFCV